MSSALRRLALVVAVVAIIVVVVVVALAATRGQTKTVAVTRDNIAATIQTDGTLNPRDPTTVFSTVTGQASLVAVSPGDTVKAGDVLVELDQQPFQDAIQRAQQQLDVAENAVYMAEQQGGTNPSPQQLATTLQADQNLKQAHKELDDAQKALVSSLILAPTDGTVISVGAANNAPVTQGMQVAQIANLNDMTLQVDLDEVDLPQVTTGMKVSFTLDAYPGKQINGTLTSISPVAQTTGGATTFQGSVDFSAPKGLLLRPGMNANVTINTAVRDNVLVIPQSALRTVGKRTFVTVDANGKQQQREIQTGLRANGMVEVASGLKEGERVVVP